MNSEFSLFREDMLHVHIKHYMEVQTFKYLHATVSRRHVILWCIQNLIKKNSAIDVYDA